MNYERKQKEISKLLLEIKVKDKVIAELVHIISTNKIRVPEKLLNIIKKLYDQHKPSLIKRITNVIKKTFEKKNG